MSAMQNRFCMDSLCSKLACKDLSIASKQATTLLFCFSLRCAQYLYGLSPNFLI